MVYCNRNRDRNKGRDEMNQVENLDDKVTQKLCVLNWNKTDDGAACETRTILEMKSIIAL